MVIELVPSMETLRLGDTNSESFNFYNASLTLRDLPSLKEVTVGVDSFHNADNSVIKNTPQLEDLIMGESGEMVGFSNVVEAALNSDKVITITNNVTKVTIPPNSYNDMNSMHLKGFPKLETLIVGDNCFTNTKNVTIANVNNLQSLIIGESSFYNSSNVVITDLPSLETITIGEDGLYCNSDNATLTMTNLPSLTNITSEGGSFRGVSTVTVSNTPNVTNVDLPFAFENVENSFVDDAGTFDGYVDSIITVSNSTELESLDQEIVRELIIPSNGCNEGSVTSLNLTGMAKLERLVIGENSLKNVVAVTIVDSTKLKSIHIGDSSFSTSLGLHSLQDKILQVTNCSSLTDIVIGENSFAGYRSATFSSLPSLKKLEVGYQSLLGLQSAEVSNTPMLKEAVLDERGVVSYLSGLTKAIVSGSQMIRIRNGITQLHIPSNSYNDIPQLHMFGFPVLESLSIDTSSFMNVDSFVLQEVNALRVLTVNASSFFNASSVVLKELPLLERMELGLNSLYCNRVNASLVLKNLTSLQILTSEGNSFRGVQFLDVLNIPSLASLVLPNGFANLLDESVVNSAKFQELIDMLKVTPTPTPTPTSIVSAAPTPTTVTPTTVTPTTVTPTAVTPTTVTPTTVTPTTVTPTSEPTCEPPTTEPPTPEPGWSLQVDYTCDQSGYIQYLNTYSEQEKSTSRDPSSSEFQTRLGYWTLSCEHIHFWNSIENVSFYIEFTFYSDWSDDEMTSIMYNTERHSGAYYQHHIQSVPQILVNYTNYVPSNVCGRQSNNATLEAYGKYPTNNSISWAYAVTTSIEMSVKKFHKERFNEDIEIHLSAQELIDCVALHYNIEGTAVPLDYAFWYIWEKGISYQEDYPISSSFKGECRAESITRKFRFFGYKTLQDYPSEDNGYLFDDLFDFVQQGPAAMNLYVDPEFFKLYGGSYNPLTSDAVYWRPTLYGITTVFNGLGEHPTLSFYTTLRQCHFDTYEIAVDSFNSFDSYYDNLFIGWKGFIPFGKEYTEGITPEPIVIPPLDQQPLEHLVINSELDCYKLQMKNWLSITVKSMMCNREEWDLDLSQYQNLQKLVVEDFSLEKIKSLNVTGSNIEEITIGDWAFHFSTKLIMENLPVLKNVTLGVRSFCLTTQFHLGNTPLLEKLTVKKEAVEAADELILDNLPSLHSLRIDSWAFDYASRVVMQNLTKLESFYITSFGSYSDTFEIIDCSIKTIKMEYYCSGNLTFMDLPNLTRIDIIGRSPFGNNLQLINLPSLEMIYANISYFGDCLEGLEMINLPNLRSFILGEEAFPYLASVSLTNVPFMNGNMVIGDNSLSSLQVSSFHIDSQSQRLAGCMLEKGCIAEYSPVMVPLPDGGLTINDEESCSMIHLMHWSYIIIKDNLCNTITTDLNITNYPYLSLFEVGAYSLMNVKKLRIRNDPMLKEIRIIRNLDNVEYGSFFNTTEVEITHLPQLRSFEVGSYSFKNVDNLIMDGIYFSNLFNRSSIIRQFYC